MSDNATADAAKSRRREPRFKIALRNSRGTSLKAEGTSSDRVIFGIYMVAIVGESAIDTPLGKALAEYLAACEQVLATEGSPHVD